MPAAQRLSAYASIHHPMVEVDERVFSDEIRKLDALRTKIGAVLKQALGVSVRVKLVEPKTIQRSEGKAVRVIDNRGL